MMPTSNRATQIETAKSKKKVATLEESMKRCESQKGKNSAYEERFSEALTESRRDYKEGRFYSSREELMRAVAMKRGSANA